MFKRFFFYFSGNKDSVKESTVRQILICWACFPCDPHPKTKKVFFFFSVIESPRDILDQTKKILPTDGLIFKRLEKKMKIMAELRRTERETRRDIGDKERDILSLRLWS